MCNRLSVAALALECVCLSQPDIDKLQMLACLCEKDREIKISMCWTDTKLDI